MKGIGEEGRKEPPFTELRLCPRPPTALPSQLSRGAVLTEEESKAQICYLLTYPKLQRARVHAALCISALLIPGLGPILITAVKVADITGTDCMPAIT